MLNLSETEKSYIAGFLDGEGFIGLRFQSIKRKTHTVKAYNLRLGFTNTNIDILLWLQSLLGGSISKAPAIIGYKIVSHLVFGSMQSEKILRSVYPYLRIKRLQAETAFRFRDTFKIKLYEYISTGKQGGLKGQEIIPEIYYPAIKERDECIFIMKKLNKKGVTLSA